MDAVPQLSVSQAEAAREAQRRAAMFSGGNKFIGLTLQNMKFMRVSGIELVHVTPYVDERAGNITKFHLEIRGGATTFEFDSSRGVYRFLMLDSKHNRAFLASHYHLDGWIIEDEKIDAEIRAMSEEIQKQLLAKKKKNTEKTAEKLFNEIKNETAESSVFTAPVEAGQQTVAAVESQPENTEKTKVKKPLKVFDGGVQSDLIIPRAENTTRVLTP